MSVFLSADPPVAVRFMVDADADPGLLPRLLAPFARRDLLPDRMWSHRNGDMVHVELAMDAMPGEAVALVEGNLRRVIGVRTVVQVRARESRLAA